MSAREFDIVLFGATGFTGRLVAAHLARTHLPEGLRFALAGRDAGKLARVRAEIAAEIPSAAELPLLVADAHDRAALDGVASRATVVATTVGPYQRYGETLVAACAAAGTHYADINGEVPFMRRMIDLHHAEAERTGARIVPACGYDSIPSDLGGWFVCDQYRARHGEPPTAILHAAGESRGAVSGGTIASMLALFDAATSDPAVRKLLADPYALVDGPRGTDPRDPTGARFSTELDLWTGPFPMAAMNSRVVRRTHALLAAEGRGGCASARYTEVMSTGRGPRAAITAGLVSAAMTVAVPVLAVGPVRRFVAERFLPKPSEGPDEQTRRRGFFVSRFVATGSHGAVRATMRGEGDPGYDATARMLGESAMSLAFDALESPGGVRTPASTMAEPLLNRLRAQRITLELQS